MPIIQHFTPRISYKAPSKSNPSTLVPKLQFCLQLSYGVIMFLNAMDLPMLLTHHVSQCHFAMNHQEQCKYNASMGQTSQSLGLNDELDEPQSPISRGGESRGAESIGLRSEATSFSSRRGAAIVKDVVILNKSQRRCMKLRRNLRRSKFSLLRIVSL